MAYENAYPVAGITSGDSPYAADDFDHLIQADASGGNITIDLPALGVEGRWYRIVKVDSSANTVTIDPSGGETINGASTLVLAAERETVEFVNDGSEWSAYVRAGGAAAPITAVDSERFQLVTSELRFSDNMESTIDLTISAVLETISITVTESAGTVSLNLQQDGGGDLTFIFTDGYYVLDCTPAQSVALTAGSDTSPTLNYVYVLQSTKALTAATAGWPATEYAPIATVLVQSAAGVASDGAYKVHAWTDHTFKATENGHLQHINKWIRQQHATWLSGVAQTLTITPGTPDTVIFTTTAGVAQQLHEHTFPAFSGTPDVYVVNDSSTPYLKVTDLADLLTDSTGASMSGKFFSLVIWGCVSELEADCKLFCNLPGGSYNTQNALIADPAEYANYSIPAEFKGTGFLISELKLRHQTSGGGDWTSIQEVDLRGLFPALSAGVGAAASSEFFDNVFRILDDADATKEIAFQASGITTATTRTITMPDQDITLDDASDSRPPSGAAGGDLGGTYPSPTVNDGADSTAIHDNVSGEINAIASKATPIGADLLLIEDSAATNAKKKITITSLPANYPPLEIVWRAVELEPVETNFPQLTRVNGTNAKVLVRAFDDTTEEYLNARFLIPADVNTGGTVTFRAWVAAKTAAASRNVGMTFGHRPLADSESWDQTYTDVDSGAQAIDATQDDLTMFTWTSTINSLGWAASDMIQFRLSRDPGVASDLVGDMYLFMFSVEIPRA